MHKALEVKVPELRKRASVRHGYFFDRLAHLSQEYVLLQIAKLHDPAIQDKRANLSLAYILENGDWDPAVSAHLSALKTTLDRVGSDALRIARTRALCHNDLETALSGRAIGKFPNGADKSYFQALRAFAAEVHERVVGGPYAFNDHFPGNDISSLVEALNAAAAQSAGDSDSGVI